MTFRSKARTAEARGYRSGLEGAVSKQLAALGVPFRYEAERLTYTMTHVYTPDFFLPKKDGGMMIVETKGYFPSADRGKIKRALAENPGLDFRMVFSRPNQRIGKTSNTTYADWCNKQGIPWAAGEIPAAWLEEVQR